MIEELFCIVEEEQKVQKEVCNKIKEKIEINSRSLEQIKNNFREYNQSQLSPEHIINILNWAGFHIGVGAFRKENTGNYGGFHVEI